MISELERRAFKRVSVVVQVSEFVKVVIKGKLGKILTKKNIFLAPQKDLLIKLEENFHFHDHLKRLVENF